MIWRAILFVACLAFAPVLRAEEPAVSADELVRLGKYSLIKKGESPRELAAWAFAQYHLRPGKESAAAAQQAHDKGDALGTFTLLLCHRSGAGIKREPAVASALNFELREALVKKEKRSPLEEYMLAHTQAGDRAGKVVADKAEGVFAAKDAHAEVRAAALNAAVKGEFAQAMHEVALQLQQEDELEEATKLHTQAGALGLGAGNRYAGLIRVMLAEDDASVAMGIKLTMEAVEAGDVYAMINLAMFHSKGQGVAKDQAKAQAILAQAAKTGHWMGLMEQGQALLGGHYGLKPDPAGKEWLAKSIADGNADPLLFMSYAYIKGFGVAKNGPAAVRFAEAAYRQGQPQAAGALAHIYSEGLPGVMPDDDLAETWGSLAQSEFLARQLGRGIKVVERVSKIDPFSLKVE